MLNTRAQSASTPCVLELKDISLSIEHGDSEQLLLSEVTTRIPRGHFAAIIGPSGCGKSTLMKVIAGIREHTTGTIHWDGRNLSEDGDMEPHEIGYVPQFSIAYELLTVDECVEGALRLRVSGISGAELDARIDLVLKETGLGEIADRRVSMLSGGQRRRLAMAMEMASQPHLLLCDEVNTFRQVAGCEIISLLQDKALRGKKPKTSDIIPPRDDNRAHIEADKKSADIKDGDIDAVVGAAWGKSPQHTHDRD